MDDRENTHAQEVRVTVAASVLQDALSSAGACAHRLSRGVRRTRRAAPDLSDWHTAVAAVARAEESLDLAVLDLRTAGGEDA